MDAESVVGCGRDPVLEGRLLEILDAVETRRQPIAGGHHFTRNLGVAAFVGVDQPAVLEIREPDQREGQHDCDDRAGAKALACRRIDAHTASGHAQAAHAPDKLDTGRGSLFSITKSSITKPWPMSFTMESRMRKPLRS